MLSNVRSTSYSRRPNIDVLFGKDGSRWNFVAEYIPDVSTLNL